MRALLLVVCAVAFAGCRKDPAPEKPAAEVAAPAPTDREAPSAAPIQTRNRMLHDIGKQQQAARERESQFDSLLGGDR